jgi:ADP-ribose pyrophosphatase YjhB (NUDIX family)/nicotinamide mononucleotide adenylyltransferase
MFQKLQEQNNRVNKMPTETEIKHYRNPFPTTDIIIEYKSGNKDGIILIERRNNPHGYALPGGFAEYGLTLEDNARKEAKEETGLDVILENDPFCVSSDPKRDPRAHMISVAYIAKAEGNICAGDDAKKAGVYSIDEVVNLIRKGKIVFDHDMIIMKYLKEKGLYTPKDFTKLGVVGRWKPFHKGGNALLETLCDKAEHVVIGIGSTNRYNARNPFTAEDSGDMIECSLGEKYSNFSFRFIPDYGQNPEHEDGNEWTEEITKQFGCLDAFVSGNDYVNSLLKPHYRIINPAELIPKEKQKNIRATEIRLKMAKGDDSWKTLVSEPVSRYITEKKLDQRFRKDFALETLALLNGKANISGHESLEEEKNHITGKI